MDRHGVRVEVRFVFLVFLGFELTQLREPLAGFAGGGKGGGELFEHRPRVTDDSQINVAIVAELAVVDIDLNDLGRRSNPFAVAEAEVERRTNYQHEVSLREGIS